MTQPIEPEDEDRLLARWDKKFSDGVKRIEARTIERCAQVALEVDDGECGYKHAENIAAAIRKLTDEQ